MTNKPPEPSLPLRAYLWYQANPLHISFALSGRQYKRMKPPTRDEITVAACQMRFTLTTTAADFASKMYRYVRAATQKGAQLIVFPEHTGTQLVGLLPEVTRFGAAGSLQDAAEKLGGTVGDIFRIAWPAAQPIFQDTFSMLAQRFGVYIAAGTLVTPGPSGALYNGAYFYGPKGGLLGVQRKLHLLASEADWATAGSELKLFDLPFGKVAILTGHDARYWEATRLAWLQGAELVLTPAADDHGDSEPLRARKLRVRVQELPFYGVQAFLFTDLFGLRWRGRSAVHAPAPLLPQDATTLAEAHGDNDEEVLVATLNLAALRKLRSLSAPDFNTNLFLKYLPDLYARQREAFPEGRLV